MKKLFVVALAISSIWAKGLEDIKLPAEFIIEEAYNNDVADAPDFATKKEKQQFEKESMQLKKDLLGYLTQLRDIRHAMNDFDWIENGKVMVPNNDIMSSLRAHYTALISMYTALEKIGTKLSMLINLLNYPNLQKVQFNLTYAADELKGYIGMLLPAIKNKIPRLKG